MGLEVGKELCGPRPCAVCSASFHRGVLQHRAGSSQGSQDQSQGCTESKASGGGFTLPRVPPDGAELPLKPGCCGVVLPNSEPLQGRQFLWDLTGVRITTELGTDRRAKDPDFNL